MTVFAIEMARKPCSHFLRDQLIAESAKLSAYGTELDRDAARFAKDQVGLPHIFLLAIFVFSASSLCAAPSNTPNREPWLTAPDVLHYPPNHFLR
jgi:hypothetical protein